MEIIPMKTKSKSRKLSAKRYEDVEVKISNGDFSRIQELAAQEGLSYQTFITSVLHKVSKGQKVHFAQDKHV